MKIKSVKKQEVGTGEITKEYAEQTFQELLAFQGYGFCKAHATSYSVYSAVQMWLQEHYFIEYMCALLSHIDRAKEKKGVHVLNERVEYCIKHGTSIYYPDVNESEDKWLIKAGGLLAPLKNIKGFTDVEYNTIIENRPFQDLKDFLIKTKFNEKKFEKLLFANAFNKWGTVEDLYNWYYNYFLNLEKLQKEQEKQAKLLAKKKEREEKARLKKEEKERKKREQAVDLFSFNNINPDPEIKEEIKEESSSEEIIIEASSCTCLHTVSFTKSELEEKCFDLNGFIIPDNIIMKYYYVYGLHLEDLNKNVDDGMKNNLIRRLSDLDKITKNENSKPVFVLCEIKKIVQGLKTKSGYGFSKLFITDGETKLELTVWKDNVPSRIQKGNVMLLPIKITTDEETKQNKLSLAAWMFDKIDVPVLKRGEL